MARDFFFITVKSPKSGGYRTVQTISQIQDERKLRRRYVTDIQTGELLHVVTEGYYDLGLNDMTPYGRIETASLLWRRT